MGDQVDGTAQTPDLYSGPLLLPCGSRQAPEGILVAGLAARSLSKLQKLWLVELILFHFFTHL